MPLTGNIKVSPTKHIIGVNNIVIYSTIQEKYPQNLEIKRLDGLMIQLQKIRAYYTRP